MVDIQQQFTSRQHDSFKDLLSPQEIIVIVDDSPEILLLLKTYLAGEEIHLAAAANAEEFWDIFHRHNVALVLLDIGLPGKSGREILTEIAPHNPDLGIIMVTGTIDVEMAMDCLRAGADDYLTKPLMAETFKHTLHQTLKKRRLAMDNRQFQKQLQQTNFRMQFLHNLNFKMNNAYLNALELDSVLQTILAGITSEEGLKFNRAFLALYNEDQTALLGKYGVGPSSREEAGDVWSNIRKNNLDLQTIFATIAEQGIHTDTDINRTAQTLHVEADNSSHILIHASLHRKSIHVCHGQADNVDIPGDLSDMLNHDDFVVVPLFSPSQSLGVILADNFVIGTEITGDDIEALEIFASQASLAIEHSHLYRDMSNKIEELELVTRELEENKDMLMETERYSTIGYISARLFHEIRNPLTSIGGTARLLLRRPQEDSTKRYLEIMAEESAKIEKTLTNIFQFAEDIVLQPEPTYFTALIKESLALFYTEFRKNGITVELDFKQEDIVINIDAKKIKTALNQLIRTSIESMHGGGTLSVSLYRGAQDTTLTITDTGDISMESFTRRATDSADTTRTYGSGLGLTFVEQVLDLHDAVFTVREISGKGLEIALHFPGQAY
ncbi:MAG: response regulator [Desulfopila sp.]